MKSDVTKPVSRKKRFSCCGVIAGITLAAIGIHLLFSLPIVRQAMIALIGGPDEIPLPVLDAWNAIEPDTVSDVRLLEHWGNGTFQSLAWSPDGRYFAIGTSIGVNLYDGQTLKFIRSINLHAEGVKLIAFSPDGRFLATSGIQRNLVLVDLAGDRILLQSDEFFWTEALGFDKNGRLTCAVSGQDGYDILKWENGEWQIVKTGVPSGIVFVPEKQAFVFISRVDSSIHLIDAISGEEKILPYSGPRNNETVLANDFLLVYHSDLDAGIHLLLAFKEGDLLNSIKVDGRFFHPLASPDGSLLAAVDLGLNDKGRAIRLWKIPELDMIRTIQVPDQESYNPYTFVFSPSGDRLAYVVSSSIVRIFSTKENDESTSEIRDTYASLADIAVTPDGGIVALSCSGTELSLVELPSANPIATWHRREKSCGKLLRDARTIAVESYQMFTPFYREEGFVFPLLGNDVDNGDFSSDGSVSAGSGDPAMSGGPTIVSISQRRYPFNQYWNFYHDGIGFKIAVSPSGHYVAVTSASNTYLWVHGIKSERQYPTLTSRIAFSPDEKYVASVHGILELETGQFTEIEGNGNNECWMTPAFSPDGKIMAAECMYAEVLRFWQVSNGALLAELNNSGNRVGKLIFSPDGTFLVGLGSGYIEVWGIPGATH